jgi:hypothetical protein
MSDQDWNGESDDIPQCLDCGARVDGPKYGPETAPFQCIACTRGEVAEPKLHKYVSDGNRREPSCQVCGREYYDAIHQTEDVDMNIGSAFKSNYLKAAEIGTKRVLVTIDRVEIERIEGESKEDKPVLYFAGHERGLVLNRTNADEITAIIGDPETDRWSGHKIVLYVDPTVMYAGKRVGGIRVMAPPPGKGGKPTPPPEPVEVVEGFGVSDEDVPF